MGIRKKFFLISAAFILIILIISYSVMYLYFYRTIFRETVINQRTNVELNRRMADVKANHKFLQGFGTETL